MVSPDVVGGVPCTTALVPGSLAITHQRIGATITAGRVILSLEASVVQGMALEALKATPAVGSDGWSPVRRATSRRRVGCDGGIGIVDVIAVVCVGAVCGVVVVSGERYMMEREPFFIVVLAEYLVVEQVETVANTEPVIALLAGEAFQMVHVAPCPHDHFESGNSFVARRAKTRCSKEPEIISFAQDEVCFGEEGRPDFS